VDGVPAFRLWWDVRRVALCRLGMGQPGACLDMTVGAGQGVLGPAAFHPVYVWGWFRLVFCLTLVYSFAFEKIMAVLITGQ